MGLCQKKILGMRQITDHLLIQFPIKIAEEGEGESSLPTPADSSTDPLYHGTRRRFRHNLDRVVNGDLPSSDMEAKSHLIELENSYEAFFMSLMPMTSAGDFLALKNWTFKSMSFIDDVERITEDDTVNTMAQEMRRVLMSIRPSAADAVDQLQPPDFSGLAPIRVKARLKFWLLFLLPIVIPIQLKMAGAIELNWHALDSEAVEELLGTYAFVWLVSVFGFGVCALNRSKQARVRLQTIVEDQERMRVILSNWS